MGRTISTVRPVRQDLLGGQAKRRHAVPQEPLVAAAVLRPVGQGRVEGVTVGLDRKTLSQDEVEFAGGRLNGDLRRSAGLLQLVSGDGLQDGASAPSGRRGRAARAWGRSSARAVWREAGRG